MTILLIGAHGQLGSELLVELAALGQVVPTCRPAAAQGQQVSWRRVDLAEPDSLRAAVREVRPRVIVNAAAYTAVDAAENDRAAAQATNAVAPGILAEEAGQLGAALVHFSTDYVFAGDSDRPWREDDPIAPLNAYGQSKADGEAAVRHRGAAHLILRTSWLYGAVGRNFVKTMLQLAANRDEIAVVADQVGSPTSAHFVARATSHLIGLATGQPGWFERNGGTLHVACAGQTSWHGFATEIFRQAVELGLPVKPPRIRPVTSAEFPTPARRPRCSTLDVQKLAQDYGITPPGWEQELRNRLAAVYAGWSSGTSHVSPSP